MSIASAHDATNAGRVMAGYYVRCARRFTEVGYPRERRIHVSQLIRSEIDNCSVLSALLEESGLKIVDIGGRGKAIGSNLATFSEYFVSEPEAEEADRLRHTLPLEAPWRRVIVMPEAIAARIGEAHLYLTHEPGMSSLLEPDPKETSRLYLHDSFSVV